MDYSEVVAAAVAYSDRSDSATSSSMQSFIQMAEARINRALRTEEMCILLDIPTVADQAAYALPADFGGLRSISLETDGAIVPLRYFNPELMDWQVDADIYTDTAFYTLLSKEVVVMKPPVDALSNIRLRYFKKVPALTSVANTNWLATMHPDVYVNAIMIEISAFVKNPEAAVLWDKRFSDAIAEVIQSNWNDKWSGTPMVMVTE